MSGDVDMMVQLTSANMVSHINGSKLNAIALTASDRLAYLPDVPTTAETWLPDFQVEAWYGVFAPGGLSEELVHKINDDVRKVVAMPDVQAQLDTLNIRVDVNSPEEFDEFVRAEHDLWARV